MHVRVHAAAVRKWKKATNMIKSVDAADAATYTVEFEEFKEAVGKVCVCIRVCVCV
jgi:hypothetical protein